MLTSKQRAKLKGLANSIETILQVGKGGISEQVIRQADEALTARELIKGQVLETAPESVREVAQEIAQAVNAEVVHTIGMRFVLYRPHPKKPAISLD